MIRITDQAPRTDFQMPVIIDIMPGIGPRRWP